MGGNPRKLLWPWEKVREDVLVIHDHHSPVRVLDDFVSHIDLPDELAEELRGLEPSGTAPRQFFAYLNTRLEPAQRYRLLGRVVEPVEADLYAAA